MENISPPSPSFSNQITPTLLLIILLLAVIFFLSGLLHLLIRFLLRPSPLPSPNLPSTSLQGNLRQLFHLHDSGVDQSFIDTLPIFPYNSIIGLNDPFDCAVCLSEFEPHHLLRLLPNCSHAFHTHCIDTWLLSHSTCPLCRDLLRPSPSPAVLCVLEAGADSFRDPPQASEIDLGEIESANSRIVTVKLGKFKNDGIKKLNSSRRCFSMESFAYETNSLQVPIRSKRESFSISKIWRRSGELKSRTFSFRFPVSVVSAPASEIELGEIESANSRNVTVEDEDGIKKLDSRRCFSMESFAYIVDESNSLRVPIRAKKVGGDSRAESFSISKIWRRSGELKSRAFSFRFPVSGRAESVVLAAGEQLQGGEIEWWENQSKNKVVHSSSSSSNV